jgi:DNA-binding CsgD family transcriptional regulator
MVGPEEALERAEYALDARERLAALKPQEIRALSLLAAGYSYAEIGKLNRWTYG